MIKYEKCIFCTNRGFFCKLCSLLNKNYSSSKHLFFKENPNVHIYINDPLTGLTNKEILPDDLSDNKK